MSKNDKYNHGDIFMIREFWIDDILNVDSPNTKTAYIYEQDTEKFHGNSVHVIEYSAFEKLKAENEKAKQLIDSLKLILQFCSIENVSARESKFEASRAVKNIEAWEVEK